jgi:hypothetical protein
MRGASAAAGAAHYTLSLRYANGAFGTRRKLSGRGRFVSLEPVVMDFDPTTSQYTVIGEAKDAVAETTWLRICQTGAVTTEHRTSGEIAKAANLVGPNGVPTRTEKRHVERALTNRDGVLRSEELRNGKKTWLYRRTPEASS